MQRGVDAAKRGDVDTLLKNLARHVKVAKIEEVGVPILEGYGRLVCAACVRCLAATARRQP